MPTDQTKQRLAILSAVVVAIALAGGLWYVLAIRPSANDSQPEASPTVSPTVTPTASARTSPGVAALPDSQPASTTVTTTSPAGAAEWVAAAAVLATLAGAAGFRRVLPTH